MLFVLAPGDLGLLIYAHVERVSLCWRYSVFLISLELESACIGGLKGLLFARSV